MTQDNNHVYDLCEEHMHAYVLAEMIDGTKVDGIITGVDDEHVYFAVPMGDENESRSSENKVENNERQFGGWQGGYGGGYGYGNQGYPGYGYGYSNYGYRPRFRRLILPLTALAALSLLPWY